LSNVCCAVSEELGELRSLVSTLEGGIPAFQRGGGNFLVAEHGAEGMTRSIRRSPLLAGGAIGGLGHLFHGNAPRVGLAATCDNPLATGRLERLFFQQYCLNEGAELPWMS
jgi:hypothetical protein